MNGILYKLAFISIRKNKIRTLSTAIGIMLAVTLMTVVVILASSISASMIAGATEKYGSWHIMSEEMTQTQLEDMQGDGMIESVCFVRNYGYAQIDSPVDSSMPYIYVADVSQTFPDFLSCELRNGRMPQNGAEIAVTAQFLQDYPAIDINSVIQLSLGQRILGSTGEALWQNASYLGADKEQIESTGEACRYTVVGVLETVGSLEYQFSPGYTFLTCGIEEVEENTKVYIRLDDLSSTFFKLNQYLSEDKIIYNKNLLNYLGVSDGENLQDILHAIVAILIVMIGAAALVLINNSLMTSSEERSKQFGILFSVGMTRVQTMLMYIAEVLFMGLLSVAAGIALGVLFAVLSFNAIGSFIAKTSYLNLSLTVNINVAYIAVVVLIAFAVLTVAAFVNAFGQLKGSAIAKLRKTSVIKPPKEKRRTPPKQSRMSVERNVVMSSFKRYGKKYRYVVISLSFSAVLFVAAGLFGNYAGHYIKEIMPTEEYDIAVISRGDALLEAVNTQYNSLSALDEVGESGWLCFAEAGYVALDELEINEAYHAYAQNENITEIAVNYIIVSDESFSTLSGATTDGIYFFDHFTYYSNGKSYHSQLLQNNSAEFQLYYGDGDRRSAHYENGLSEKNSTTLTVAAHRAEGNDCAMELKAVSSREGLFLILPMSRLNEFVDETPTGLQMYFSAADHSSAVQKIKQLGEENGWNLSVTDIAEGFEKEKSTYAMYEIFAMIFILLISIVTIINAFNAVSANYIKRRREFAVLQSVGLSNRSFYKIILYECSIFCGIVIAVTLFLTPILSAVLSASFPVAESVFVFPWEHLIIVTISLFMIFAASMIKPVMTIKRQNIIETIKGDSD